MEGNTDPVQDAEGEVAGDLQVPESFGTNADGGIIDETWAQQAEKQFADRYGGDFIKVVFNVEQSRESYFCDVCEAELNTKKIIDLHCGGARHDRKVKELEELKAKGITTPPKKFVWGFGKRKGLISILERKKVIVGRVIQKTDTKTKKANTGPWAEFFENNMSQEDEQKPNEEPMDAEDPGFQFAPYRAPGPRMRFNGPGSFRGPGPYPFRGPRPFMNPRFGPRPMGRFDGPGPGFCPNGPRQFSPNGPGGPNQFGPNGPGFNQFGPNGPRPNQFGQNWPRPNHFRPNGPGPNQFGPNRPGNNHFGPNGPGPNQFGPNGPGLNQFGPNGPGPDQFGPNGPGSKQFGSGQGSNHFDANGSGPNQFGPDGSGPEEFGEDDSEPNQFGQDDSECNRFTQDNAGGKKFAQDDPGDNPCNPDSSDLNEFGDGDSGSIEFRADNSEHNQMEHDGAGANQLATKGSELNEKETSDSGSGMMGSRNSVSKQMGSFSSGPEQLGSRLPGSNQMGARVSGTNELDPRGSSPSLTGPRATDSNNLGDGGPGFTQMGPRSSGPNQMGLRGPNIHQIGPRGPGPNQMGPRGPGPNQMGPGGPGPNQMGPRGPGPNQMGPRGPGSNQMGARGPGPNQMGPRGLNPNQMGSGGNQMRSNARSRFVLDNRVAQTPDNRGNVGSSSSVFYGTVPPSMKRARMDETQSAAMSQRSTGGDEAYFIVDSNIGHKQPSDEPKDFAIPIMVDGESLASGGSTGILLKKLAGCVIKSEKDAELALTVSNALVSSLREYYIRKEELKTAELLMNAELKLNTLKAMKVGLKLLDEELMKKPSSSAASKRSSQQAPPQSAKSSHLTAFPAPPLNPSSAPNIPALAPNIPPPSIPPPSIPPPSFSAAPQSATAASLGYQSGSYTTAPITQAQPSQPSAQLDFSKPPPAPQAQATSVIVPTLPPPTYDYNTMATAYNMNTLQPPGFGMPNYSYSAPIPYPGTYPQTMTYTAPMVGQYNTSTPFSVPPPGPASVPLSAAPPPSTGGAATSVSTPAAVANT